MNGETLSNFTELLLLHSPVLRGGWHFYTISQTGKQRTRNIAEAKESSIFPSLCSYIHGRNRPFSFSIWQQTFIPLFCFPKLLLSQKLSWRCTETEKEATPSSGSLQWNLPIPPAILHRPHKPTQEFKDELIVQLFPTTTSGPWSPFHPAPKRNQKQIYGKQCRNTETIMY